MVGKERCGRSRKGEGENVVCKRKGGDIEVSDVLEKALVGQDVVHETDSIVVG
jgi:hypothetical protein